MVDEALQVERGTVKTDILSTLEPLAVEVKTNDTYGELMIINAAFFVGKEKETDFDQQVRSLDEHIIRRKTALPAFRRFQFAHTDWTSPVFTMRLHGS